MDELPSEVLIYIQKLKIYFEKNPDAKKELFFDIDDEIVYDHISKIAQINFKERGEPMLEISQFETLRETLFLLKNSEIMLIRQKSVWMNIGKYGKICLN